MLATTLLILSDWFPKAYNMLNLNHRTASINVCISVSGTTWDQTPAFPMVCVAELPMLVL